VRLQEGNVATRKKQVDFGPWAQFVSALLLAAIAAFTALLPVFGITDWIKQRSKRAKVAIAVVIIVATLIAGTPAIYTPFSQIAYQNRWFGLNQQYFYDDFHEGLGNWQPLRPISEGGWKTGDYSGIRSQGKKSTYIIKTPISASDYKVTVRFGLDKIIDPNKEMVFFVIVSGTSDGRAYVLGLSYLPDQRAYFGYLDAISMQDVSSIPLTKSPLIQRNILNAATLNPVPYQVIVKGTHITFIVGDTTLIDEHVDRFSDFPNQVIQGGIIGFAANDTAIFTIYSISVDVV